MKNPHVGKSAFRLLPEQNNPREVAFAGQWLKEQEQGRILSHLIGKDLTDRDCMVAATVVQWLGSNVGMSFLDETIKREPKIKAYLQLRGILQEPDAVTVNRELLRIVESSLPALFDRVGRTQEWTDLYNDAAKAVVNGGNGAALARARKDQP